MCACAECAAKCKREHTHFSFSFTTHTAFGELIRYAFNGSFNSISTAFPHLVFLFFFNFFLPLSFWAALAFHQFLLHLAHLKYSIFTQSKRGECFFSVFSVTPMPSFPHSLILKCFAGCIPWWPMLEINYAATWFLPSHKMEMAATCGRDWSRFSALLLSSSSLCPPVLCLSLTAANAAAADPVV